MTRDLRRYAQQTRTRLLAGLFILVIILGEGLIWIIYGQKPAVMGLICLLAALIPVGILTGILALISWILGRYHAG